MEDSGLTFDAVVVGAGVVGLAIARALALSGRDTVLLEAEADFGSGISSRNSEVIHGGMYYATDSLKAKLCVAGNHALYPYCAAKGVLTRRLGKLIVAVDESEIATLQKYQHLGFANGVTDLTWLDQADVRSLEPELHAVAGLYSPSTGIVDSHGLMRALLTDFEQSGGIFVARSKVLGGTVDAGAIMLELGGIDPCYIKTKLLVNAGGMGAQVVASSLSGFPKEYIPGLYFAIGHYFSLQGTSPFRHLVYPVAVAGGLGVHLTLDLAGQARFGPDISWRDSENYSFDAARVETFYRAIRRYWPRLPDGKLSPAYTGIRPKLFGPTCPDQDFVISGPEVHGVPGVVNLFGIESPGLTASLALADHVLTVI